MAVSKVILNGDVLMDVTQDTVTEGTLLSGQTATGADGVRLTGSAVIPSPSSTAPAMDGTAAVGTSAKYAREDHVHPTDMSRLSGVTLDTSADTYVVPVANGVATVNIGDGLKVSDSNDRATISAKTGTTSGTVATGDHTHSGYAPTSHEHSGADITSGTVGFAYLPTGTGASQVAVGNHTHSGYASSTHFHGSITSVGAITSDTTAESGDKLVIVDANDANKLKRSNIALGTSTSTFLRNDGQWATPSGGGGGGSWTDVTSDWAAENPDAQLTAMTDGTFVYVSGTFSIEVAIPDGYEARGFNVGAAYNLDLASVDAVVAEDSMTAIYTFSGEQSAYAMSILYPIATS